MYLKTLKSALHLKKMGVRVLSTVLAVLMLAGTFVIGVNAAAGYAEYTYKTDSDVETMDYLTGINGSVQSYLAEYVINTEDEKLSMMDLRYAAYGYEL